MRKLEVLIDRLKKYEYVFWCIFMIGCLFIVDKQFSQQLNQISTDPYYEHAIDILEELESINVGDALAKIEIIKKNRLINQDTGSGTNLKESAAFSCEEGYDNETTYPLGEKEELNQSEQKLIPSTEQLRTYFQNDVFMGDSLVEGFSAYQYLDTSSVVAKVGSNVASAGEQIQSVINLAPKRLYLLYGLNDLQIYQDEIDFIRAYDDLISTLKEKLPSTTIYITSIFPVQDWVSQEQPNLSGERIKSFNHALQQMCEEEGYRYIDVGSSLDNSYYEQDGMHVKASFYPIWMETVWSTIESSEGGRVF